MKARTLIKPWESLQLALYATSHLIHESVRLTSNKLRIKTCKFWIMYFVFKTDQIFFFKANIIKIFRFHNSSCNFQSFFPFLDASSHLYFRSCPSVRRSVGWSVRPSPCNQFFFKCQKWAVFSIKIFGAVHHWHCWMCWVCWVCLMCFMCLICPRTHRWPSGPCFLKQNFCYWKFF